MIFASSHHFLHVQILPIMNEKLSTFHLNSQKPNLKDQISISGIRVRPLTYIQTTLPYTAVSH